MSVSQELVVQNSSGLHARPAARFVAEARRFSSDLSLEKDGKVANCKSILSLLKLGINKGSTIRLKATGSDEPAALASLVALMHQLASEEVEHR